MLSVLCILLEPLLALRKPNDPQILERKSAVKARMCCIFSASRTVAWFFLGILIQYQALVGSCWEYGAFWLLCSLHSGNKKMAPRTVIVSSRRFPDFWFDSFLALFEQSRFFVNLLLRS